MELEMGDVRTRTATSRPAVGVRPTRISAADRVMCCRLSMLLKDSLRTHADVMVSAGRYSAVHIVPGMPTRAWRLDKALVAYLQRQGRRVSISHPAWEKRASACRKSTIIRRAAAVRLREAEAPT
jgi:hypothetical protein